MFDKFFNIEGATDLRFTEREKQVYRSFVESELAPGTSTSSLYWCDFLSMFTGNRRSIPCAFDRYVLSLYPTGEVLPCSREEWIVFGDVYEEAVDEIWYGERAKRVRRRMKKEVCPTCTFYCAVEFSLRKEFFKYLAFFLGKRFFGRSQRGRSTGPAAG
jgi:MoaA/NifB/PqqE/SkfB family radical SAM enzyme